MRHDRRREHLLAAVPKMKPAETRVSERDAAKVSRSEPLLPGRFECWLYGCRAALASDLVHNHTAGDRDVQGRHASQHRDRDQVIAFLAHQLMQPIPLRSQGNCAIHSVVNLIVALSAALIETNDPDPLFLQVIQSAGEVHYARD